jgi:hypothetical protein
MKYLIILIFLVSCSGKSESQRDSGKILDNRVGTFKDLFKEIDE